MEDEIGMERHGCRYRRSKGAGEEAQEKQTRSGVGDDQLCPEKPGVGKERFWREMVAARLTTQQRSGTGSFVDRFVSAKPFKLSYQAMRRSRNVRDTIAKALQSAGGIRFSDKIADDLAYNFKILEEGLWDATLQECGRLTRNVPRKTEQEVAEFLHSKFKGFGPKQSRNLLQSLGLTRYEIPIDSRVVRWLNASGFPLRLSATALADANFYNFVLGGIQLLCAESKVPPCVFDAAAFLEGETSEAQ
jgi:hypothetical protein